VTLAAFLSSTSVIVFGVVTVALVGWLIWYRKRRSHELQYLKDLQKQLG